VASKGRRKQKKKLMSRNGEGGVEKGLQSTRRSGSAERGKKNKVISCRDRLVRPTDSKKTLEGREGDSRKGTGCQPVLI